MNNGYYASIIGRTANESNSASYVREKAKEECERKVEIPLFSVIVTVYNKEKYIRRCLESILNQTYDDIEVVVIDDGSTDASGQIIDEFATNDKRIVVKHKKNGGLTKARKDGIGISNGEYVIFVDADDWIQENACEILANSIKQSKYDIVIGGIEKVFDKHRQLVKEAIPSGNYLEREIEECIIPNMIYTGRFFEKGLSSYICGKAICRRVLEEIKDDISNDVCFGEGCAWLYMTILRSRKLCILDDVIYNYAMNEDSMAISETSLEDIYSLYKCLKDGIYRYKGEHESLLIQNEYLAYYHLIWKKPNLFNYDESVFYPFNEISRDSKIIIYGAWRFGTKLYTYLKDRDFGDIIMLVDKNDGYNETIQRQVFSPDYIVGIKYDYIILGSVIYSVIQSMIKVLKKLGIKDRILYLSNERVDLGKMPPQFQRV